MQLQLITGLLPAHAALHVQPVDVHCDVLDVFRGDPGPCEYTEQTVQKHEIQVKDLNLRN